MANCSVKPSFRVLQLQLVFSDFQGSMIPYCGGSCLLPFFVNLTRTVGPWEHQISSSPIRASPFLCPLNSQYTFADLLAWTNSAHQQNLPLQTSRDTTTFHEPCRPPPQRALPRLDPYLPRSTSLPSTQSPHALLQNGGKQTHSRIRSNPARHPHVPFWHAKRHGGGKSPATIPPVHRPGNSCQVRGPDGYDGPAGGSGTMG